MSISSTAYKVFAYLLVAAELLKIKTKKEKDFILVSSHTPVEDRRDFISLYFILEPCRRRCHSVNVAYPHLVCCVTTVQCCNYSTICS